MNFDRTLKDNGGVGGWASAVYPSEPFKELINYKTLHVIVRFLYENLSNIWFVVIIIQIVGGNKFSRFYLYLHIL